MSNQFGSFSDEMGFEAVERNQAVQQTSTAVKSAATGAVNQVAQQAKAAVADATGQFLDALYGSSAPTGDEPSPDTTHPTGQPQPQKPNNATGHTAGQPIGQATNQTDPTKPQGEQAEIAAARRNIQELEEEIKKHAEERTQRDQEREQEEQQEKQQMAQLEEQKKQEVPLAVQNARSKSETRPGAG